MSSSSMDDGKEITVHTEEQISDVLILYNGVQRELRNVEALPRKSMRHLTTLTQD